MIIGTKKTVFDVTLSKILFEPSKTAQKYGSFGCHVCRSDAFVYDKNAFIYIVRSLIFNNIAGNETKQQFPAFILKAASVTVHQCSMLIYSHSSQVNQVNNYPFDLFTCT